MKLNRKFGISGLAAIILLTAGCLISGTFVVTVFFTEADFTTRTGFYIYEVDLTEEDVWQDHKDDIENIDVVGVEVWITNNEEEAATFSVYVDDFVTPLPMWNTEADLIAAGVPRVFGDLVIQPGQNHITYAQSLTKIENLEELKRLAELGRFLYFGVSDIGTTLGYTIDSGRVVVTLSASNT